MSCWLVVSVRSQAGPDSFWRHLQLNVATNINRRHIISTILSTFC